MSVNRNSDHMRLAEFIRANTASIIAEWENFARTFVPAGGHMTPLALRNHIRQILSFISADIESAQTDAEQVTKSHGEKPRLFYPSGGHKPMLTLTILMVRINAAPCFYCGRGRPACARGQLPPRRLQPNRPGPYRIS